MVLCLFLAKPWPGQEAAGGARQFMHGFRCTGCALWGNIPVWVLTNATVRAYDTSVPLADGSIHQEVWGDCLQSEHHVSALIQ